MIYPAFFALPKNASINWIIGLRWFAGSLTCPVIDG